MLRVVFVIILWTTNNNVLKPDDITSDDLWMLVNEITDVLNVQTEQPIQDEETDADDEAEEMAPID